MQNIIDIEILEKLKQEGALFVLFGGEHCNVCQSLRPQISTMLEQRFPEMQIIYIDCEAAPEICAQHRVFSLPAVKVYIEGMLIVEDARVFSLSNLRQRMERPYAMWLESDKDDD